MPCNIITLIFRIFFSIAASLVERNLKKYVYLFPISNIFVYLLSSLGWCCVASVSSSFTAATSNGLISTIIIIYLAENLLLKC